MPKVKICMIPKSGVCVKNIPIDCGGCFVILSKISFTYLNEQEHISFHSKVQISSNTFSTFIFFMNHLLRGNKYIHNKNKLKLYPKMWVNRGEIRELTNVYDLYVFECYNYSKVHITFKITDRQPTQCVYKIVSPYFPDMIFNTKFIIISGTDINEMNKICVDNRIVKIYEDQCDNIDTILIYIMSVDGEQVKLCDMKEFIKTYETNKIIEKPIKVIIPNSLHANAITVS